MALPLLFLAAALARPAPLGSFARWGVFRAQAPERCYAVTQARRRATLAFVAAPGVRPQLAVRLGREAVSAEVRIGERTFPLRVQGGEAWAADARADARIVAAAGMGGTADVRAVDARGGRVGVSFALEGAATAIDAAVLGCLRSGRPFTAALRRYMPFR